jgi:hypothetical protein
MPPPKAIIKKLQWWLQKHFRGPFKDCGDAIEHGLQADGTECGIITPNTVAQEVFHDDLWTTDCKVLECINWFCKLSAAHVEDVRIYWQELFNSDLLLW